MKKILYTALVVFLCSMSLEAQEWFPAGGKWTYETFFPFGGPGSDDIDVVTCEEEVEIDGIKARVIKGGTMCSYSNYGESIMYHNKSEDIVYIYLDGEFKVYFDFSKKAGESYYMNYQDDDQRPPQFKTLTITVDSVVTKKINGLDVRYQYITGWRGPIIEYIGSAYSFYPESGSCDFELSNGLRCYMSEDIVYYSKPIFETHGCDYRTSTEELEQSLELEIFPNPCAGVLNLKTNESCFPLECEIYNSVGKLVMSSTVHESNPQLNLHNVAAGIYLLKFKDEKLQCRTHKIVKQ